MALAGANRGNIRKSTEVLSSRPRPLKEKGKHVESSPSAEEWDPPHQSYKTSIDFVVNASIIEVFTFVVSRSLKGLQTSSSPSLASTENSRKRAPYNMRIRRLFVIGFGITPLLLIQFPLALSKSLRAPDEESIVDVKKAALEHHPFLYQLRLSSFLLPGHERDNIGKTAKENLQAVEHLRLENEIATCRMKCYVIYQPCNLILLIPCFSFWISMHR